MQKIQDAVLSSTPYVPSLPLVHSTSLYNFRSILVDNILSTSECRVFNEDIVYLFYGKPSYRVASKDGPRTDLTHCPICFILNYAAFGTARRIFPFDSGAFHNGLYSHHFPREYKLEEFCLGTSLDIPLKVVNMFFGSNRSYLLGETRPLTDKSALDFEINSYFGLITSSGESCVDDRKSSIELQIDHGIALSKDTVLAVVLPKACMDDEEVRDAINITWQATPITYNTFKATSPLEYHGVIREQLTNFLDIEGLLK